jgi:hypothetical protein
MAARERVHASQAYRDMKQAGRAAAKLAYAFVGGFAQAVSSSSKDVEQEQGQGVGAGLSGSGTRSGLHDDSDGGSDGAMHVGCSVCGCIMEVTRGMGSFQCPNCSCILQLHGGPS